MLLTAETILTGRELLRPGWIDISNGTVAALGAGAAPRDADRDLGAVTVVPGFVDTHVHGGDGANFSTASADDTATALGVTTRTVNRDWQFARAWLHDHLKRTAQTGLS